MNELDQLTTMTEEEIIAEAINRGYRIYNAGTGERVGGSPSTHGPDLWMNRANVRLRKLQTDNPPHQ